MKKGNVIRWVVLAIAACLAVVGGTVAVFVLRAGNKASGDTLEKLAGAAKQQSFSQAVGLYLQSPGFQAEAGAVKSFKETGSSATSNSFPPFYEKHTQGANYHYETDRETGTFSVFAEQTEDGWSVISMKRFPDSPPQGS